MKDYDELELDEIPERQTPSKRRKRHPIRLLLTVFLVTAVLIFGVYSAVAMHYINMVETVEDGERTEQDAELMSSKSVRNILIIGTDTRSADDVGRSDVVMMVSVNFKTKKITLTSFMRDCYVDIPGKKWSKLNAAYRWGGPELLMDTLERNFCVEIDDYVFVDFESFSKIVDAVGGVEITVSGDEAKGMEGAIRELNRLNGLPETTDFLNGGGTYTMNGKQALAYARLRYVGNADFKRTERQREVMKKIIKKAKGLGLSELGDFASTCASSLQTNLTKGEMYKLSLQMIYFMSFDVEELRIPIDGGYSGGTSPDGQSVLNINFDVNIAELEDKLYSEA